MRGRVHVFSRVIKYWPGCSSRPYLAFLMTLSNMVQYTTTVPGRQFIVLSVRVVANHRFL